MTEIVSSTIQTPFQAPSTSTTSMSAALSSNEKTMSSPNIFNTSSLDVTLAYQSYLNSSGQEPTPFHLQSMLLPNMCLTLFEEEKYEFRPLPTMHATMDSMMFMFGCSENEIVPLDHNNLKNGDMILIASKSNITLKKMFLGFREDGTFFTDSLPSNKCIFLVKHKSNLGFALSIESGAYACVESRQFRLTTNYFYDECTFFLKPTSSNVLLKEVTKMMESHSSSTLVKQKSTALFPPLSATIEILPPQPTDTKSHLLTRMASSDSMAQPFMHAKSYSQLQPKPSMNLIMSPSSMVPNSKEPLSTYSKPSLVRFQGGPSIFQSPSATKEPLNFLSHVAILDSKKRFLVEPKFDHILKFQKLKIKKKYCPQILFFELLSLSAPCIPPPIDLCHLTALNLHQSTSYVLLKTPSNMYLNVNLDQTLKLVSTPNECSIFLFKSLPHSPIAFALQSYPFNAYLGRKNKTCKALGATLSLRESFTFHVPPLPQQALQVQNMRPPPKPPLAMSVAIVSGT
ncbi:hypothetical protein HMI54_001273 [Coelomomyces lativittatus]|nr:hypothetical protein HMI55_006829 [Coelomomyces lativittatus]KAJ1510876.1 hypothetical protein HMI54_001273 [Coelomomyces lativittatus]